MPIQKDGKTLLTQEELQPIFDGNAIIDCSKGGLLMGNYHSEGGIKVIRKYEDNLYEVVAELEGWEYVMCPEATYWDVEYLKAINDEFTGTSDDFVEYEIPDHITLIDAKPIFEGVKESGKILLFEDYAYYIINKNSTKKYLEELNTLNKKYSR